MAYLLEFAGCLQVNCRLDMSIFLDKYIDLRRPGSDYLLISARAQK